MLRRRSSSVSLSERSAASALIVILVGSAAHMASGSGAPKHPKVSPYDQSETDQALAAFDRHHPLCALWTDWRKLCSRTGPKGSTYCRTDPEHPVTPSTPFCERSFAGRDRDTTYEYESGTMTAVELKSALRFSHMVQEEASLRGDGRYHSSPPYAEWAADRPFSGTSLRQMESPICASWRLKTIDGSERSCSEGKHHGLASCTSSDYETRHQDIVPECAVFKRSNPCTAFRGRIRGTEINLIDGLGRFNQGSISGFYSGTRIAYPNRRAVWGLYCPMLRRR